MAVDVAALLRAKKVLENASPDSTPTVGMTHGQCAELHSKELADEIWAHHSQDHNFLIFFWPDGRTTTR